MAFRTNENQQMNMSDNLYNLSERGMRILKKSWAEDFANHIFPNLPEEPFSVLFSDNDASKPNIPVNIILGMLMLKEQFDLTDEEMMHQFMFNIQFQCALHTSSFKEQPVNDNTFRRFRNRVAEYEELTGVDLVKEAFKVLKDGTEISPESMQTPHDPDATYRKKAGKGNIGYAANIEEACDGDKRLITDYDLQKNTYSDAKFGEDMIDAIPDGGGDTKVAVFDGAYASTELVDKAAARTWR